MNKRPLAVTIIAFVYLLLGLAGFGYHLTGIKTQHPFQYDILWIELIFAIAAVCGVYLLRGQNWARWIALAWMAFHVVVSAFNNFRELAIHSLLCAIIAYFLFRPSATRYFRHDTGPRSK
jgi:hypothetical protein